MADTPADAGFDTGIISRLARTRFMTRSVMVVERAWPLVLPILLVIGLHLGELAVMGVLNALYPLGTVLLALVVLRERLSRLQVLGILLAIAASAVLALG